jgi:ABC-type sugar transport system permease subunit
MARRLERRKSNSYVLLVSWALIVFFTFVSFWPFLFNIFISTWKVTMEGDNMFERFVGLKYYELMFTNDVFLKALLNNLYYLIVLTAGSIVVSLIFAFLINQTTGVAKKIYTALYFAPVITNMAAVSLIWKLAYFPKVGVLSVLMNALFGIGPLTFMEDPNLALWCILLMDLWKRIGLMVIIFLAGIDDIPDTYYEAATLDGATQVKRFRYITIPLLMPQIFFLFIITSIDALKTFIPVYMMTKTPHGGPVNSTQLLTLFMYQKTFDSQQFGYGAAAAMIMFLLLFVFVLVQIKAYRRKGAY